jgi:alkylation response protein AidB-like acyl-CoA dehydrogenase
MTSEVEQRRAKVQTDVAAVAAGFAAQRQERLRRTSLDKRDFDALAGAGYLLTGVPADRGGLWTGIAGSIRSYAKLLGTIAEADPSVALVASMHPSVLAAWLAGGDDGDAALARQRDAFFGSALRGEWWGTVASEPGSGGDVMKTRTRAEPAGNGRYLLTGDKHFGSGSGITTCMFTTALPADGEGPDLFVIEGWDRPWDRSWGVEIAAEWDGHGMSATQSHAFRLKGCEAIRAASPVVMEKALPVVGVTASVLFASVVAAVVRTAVKTGHERLAPKASEMRPYERVEWTKVANAAWLIEQALEGMIRAAETEPDPRLSVNRGKASAAELAETAMMSLSRVIGGASFARGMPFGQWAQDVKALGFLRPPWGLAFDQMFGQEFPEQI